jgi:bacteriocin biosynthesis cyclodehydratase domain-containing protein
MRKIALKKSVYLAGVDKDIALFMAFGSRYYLEGEWVNSGVLEVVARLVKPISVTEMLDSAPDPKIRELWLDLLSALAKQGFLEEFDDEFDDEFEDRHADLPKKSFPSSGALSWTQGLLSSLYSSVSNQLSALAVLEKARIGILDQGISSPYVLKALDSIGLKNLTYFGARPLEGWTGNPLCDPAAYPALDLYVVLATWYDREWLCALNAAFQSRGQRWLLVLEDSHGGSIGPEFGIEDGPCFQCLVDRRDSHLVNIEKYALFERFNLLNKSKEKAVAPMVGNALHELATFETVKALLSIPDRPALGGIVEFDFWNLRTSQHRIVSMPFCEVCSDAFRTPLATL